MSMTLSSVKAANNDFRGIVGPWEFPKGFFRYAQAVGLRRAALGRS